jgi:hypothetical protein
MAEVKRRRLFRDGIFDTAKDLFADVPRLVREEIALAGAQARLTIRAKSSRAALIAATGFLAALGTIFLAMGASTWVSERVDEDWAGPLVTGGGLVVIASGLTLVVLAISRRGKREESEDE